MNKKECLRRKRSSKRESIRVGGSGGGGGGGGVGPAGDSGGLGGQQISMPTKLTQLRYSGYSAEFLDRVEPNGNIPGKNGTAGIAGMYVLKLYVKRTDTAAVLELTAKKRFF